MQLWMVCRQTGNYRSLLLGREVGLGKPRLCRCLTLTLTLTLTLVLRSLSFGADQAAKKSIICNIHGPDLWHEAWPLRNYRAARRGRDGLGLSGAGFAPGPYCRHQDSSVASLGRCDAPSALRARGQSRLQLESSPHRSEERRVGKECRSR